MASTYLSRTPASAGNRKTFTISVWVKRTNIGVETAICSAWDANNISSHFVLRISPTDAINIGRWSIDDITTNRLFRDTNAWYHIVLAVDTTQATAADRMKLYVNGVQETSFSVTTYPNQNDDLKFNSNVPHNIGRNLFSSPSGLFQGCMSHFHFIDGTAYLPTVFGETDATTGEWKIKTNVTATYGTNGFFILKDGNSVTDQSGNSNNFTVAAGTLTNTEDNPSNVFATLNRLQRSRKNTNNGGDYLTQGNNTFDTSSSNAMMAVVLGTIGVQSRKYYWEYKVITNSRLEVGISQANVMGFTSPYYDLTTFSTIAMNASGQISGRYTGSAIDQFSSGTSNTTNDIIGLALDMDNKALYIHKNGTYLSNGTAVGVPTSGSSRTGSLIEPLAGSRDDYIPDGQFIFPYVHDVSTTGVAKAEFNFGNGFFGTTQISSEGTNASGNGKFEYDVPTGYTALSTKGLNL